MFAYIRDKNKREGTTKQNNARRPLVCTIIYTVRKFSVKSLLVFSVKTLVSRPKMIGHTTTLRFAKTTRYYF